MLTILSDVSHRPYSLPEGKWVMTQNWVDLLFAHWKIPLSILQSHVPEQLPIDLFNGDAYVGVVPFRMSKVKPRNLPTVAYMSEFLELNVRTYVTVNDRPGVYFFSLDASNKIAVKLARAWYHLPYFDAKMNLCETASKEEEHANWIKYDSTRCGSKSINAFKASYRPISPIEFSQPGSLEAFLTERYCLYVLDSKNQVYRGDIHHKKWPLQKAEAIIQTNTMGAQYGFDFSEAPILHFSKYLETVEWPIAKIKTKR